MNIKLFGIAIAGAFALNTGLAQAADLPPPAAQHAAPVMPAPPAPAYNWSGLYFGGHIGYGSGKADWQETAETGGVIFDDTISGANQRPTDHPKGILGGFQTGYNIQMGSLVFGPDVSFSFADIDDDSVSTFGGADDQYDVRIRNIFTASLRLGWAIDQFLVYAKGGYAGADIKLKITDTMGTVGSYQKSQWQSGFVVGGGIEFLLTPNVIFGAEYNYIDFGNKSFTGTGFDAGAAAGTLTFKNDAHIHAVMARISWKFGDLL